MANRFGLPELGTGIGLRTVHYGEILERRPEVDWFEILSENYMQTEGRPLRIVEEIAERYPTAMHGVSMSIGSTDPLDFDYLRELKALRDRTRARWVSDHLCWTGVAGRNTHDLLPMPFTDDAVRHVATRVRQVQDYLEAPLVLENPSTYAEFRSSTMTDSEFLAAVAIEADCGVLLDVNNVYVSAKNHGFDARDWLGSVPYDRVVQIHVAGHSDHGTHVIDTHLGPVPDPVWDLFALAHARCAGASVLVEWDAEIPPLDDVLKEARRAKELARRASRS